MNNRTVLDLANLSIKIVGHGDSEAEYVQRGVE